MANRLEEASRAKTLQDSQARGRSVERLIGSVAGHAADGPLTSSSVKGDEAERAATAAVVAEVTSAARALESAPGFPRSFVERVRAATGWLGAERVDDLRHAILLLQRQAASDLEPPMAARGWPRRVLKIGVRRLVGWYLRFLGQRIGALGQATARLGLAVAERVERLGAEQAAARAELDALRARMARLEETSGTGDDAQAPAAARDELDALRARVARLEDTLGVAHEAPVLSTGR